MPGSPWQTVELGSARPGADRAARTRALALTSLPLDGFPARDTAWLDVVPRARRVLLRAAGHLAHLEAPDGVCAAVAGFLDDLDRAR